MIQKELKELELINEQYKKGFKTKLINYINYIVGDLFNGFDNLDKTNINNMYRINVYNNYLKLIKYIDESKNIGAYVCVPSGLVVYKVFSKQKLFFINLLSFEFVKLPFKGVK